MRSGSVLKPVFIESARSYLPSSFERTAEAVANGTVLGATAARSGVAQLPVEHDLSAPEMAVQAAKSALLDSAVSADELEAIFYASTFFQGATFWSPAHFIAEAIGAKHATPIGLMTMCNGAGTALDLAQRHLATSRPGTRVLVSTADRFPSAAFDRWEGDYGVMYGDGATAAILSNIDTASNRPTRKLLATETQSLSELESMHRPQGRLAGSPLSEPQRHLVKPHKKAYLESHGRDALTIGFSRALRALVPRVHEAIGVPQGDARIRRVFVPRVGADTIDASYRPVLENELGFEVHHLVSETGHLGAGDTIANLAEPESLGDPGEITLFLSAGAGFTLTIAAVEALQ